MVLGGLAAGFVAARGAGEREESGASEASSRPVDDDVVFPPDQAVLLSGSFDVISKGDPASLEIDGKPWEWEPFAPPLRVAHVRLWPGVHELRIGDRCREIVVALNEEEHDGPPDWPIQQFHEINRGEGRCGDCHETSKQGGQVAVGPLKSCEACFACHEPVDFQAVHAHPLEPIRNCEACHALHASTREGLLKAPMKQLCSACHEI